MDQDHIDDSCHEKKIFILDMVWMTRGVEESPGKDRILFVWFLYYSNIFSCRVMASSPCVSRKSTIQGVGGL